MNYIALCFSHRAKNDISEMPGHTPAAVMIHLYIARFHPLTSTERKPSRPSILSVTRDTLNECAFFRPPCPIWRIQVSHHSLGAGMLVETRGVIEWV